MFFPQKMKKPVDSVWNKYTSLWSKPGKVPSHQENSAISRALSSNICILLLKPVLMTLATLHGVHPSLLINKTQNTWAPGKPGADAVCSQCTLSACSLFQRCTNVKVILLTTLQCRNTGVMWWIRSVTTGDCRCSQSVKKRPAAHIAFYCLC